MKTHEERRAGLFREREARNAAYLEAVAARESIAPFARAADATEFDRRELARAEARVEMTLGKMRDWKDPMPDAAPEALLPAIVRSVTPESSLPFRPSGVADTAEAVADRILASDTLPGEGRADTAVDAIARRIAEA